MPKPSAQRPACFDDASLISRIAATMFRLLMRHDENVTVTNVAPTIVGAGVTATAVEGSQATLFVSATDPANDTLQYFSKDPVHRRFHHNDLTFGLLYAFSENFILPLSHDEVVHGKGALIAKMPGDKWQRLANLRAMYGWMWAHPGKQLLFQGGEIGQEREWAHDRSVDWHITEDAGHRGVQELVRALNTIYRDHPALWERDFVPEGFRWIDAGDVENNVLSFLRISADGGQAVACVANLAPVPRNGYRIGLPRGGTWRELLNTDAEQFGGGGVGNGGSVEAGNEHWHGLPFSAELTLPPLAVLWLTSG